MGQEDPLEKEMATHSGILAWRIPGTEEPSGTQSMVSQKSWTQLSGLINIFFNISTVSVGCDHLRRSGN